MLLRLSRSSTGTAFRNGSSLSPFRRDTDSIFILFPAWIDTLKLAFFWLRRICDTVTTHFAPSPIALQAEKVMRRLIMINKKRYIAAKYEGIADPGHVLAKGVEIARRDNCGMVVKCMSGLVDQFLLKGDDSAALGVLSSTLKSLMAGQTDLGELVVSKAVTKEEYKSVPAHIALARRMQVRDPTYQAGLAERIPFVIVSNGGRSVSERTEDPLWAINHQIPLDIGYYVQNQLAGPVARILMWKYGSQQHKHDIAQNEVCLRELEERGEPLVGEDFDRLKKAKAGLVKAIKAMQDSAIQRFFGPAALSPYPRKIQNTSSKKGAIDSFFKRSVHAVAADSMAEAVPVFECGRCRGECAMLGPGDSCAACAIGVCSICITGRALKDSRICATCKAKIETRKRHSLPMSLFVPLAKDVEDLVASAAASKVKCDECRGYSDEVEIKCVQKDCQTLYRRASLEVMIKNLQ